MRKRESARARESRNTQINATQRTAAKSDPPEPFSGEVSTLNQAVCRYCSLRCTTKLQPGPRCPRWKSFPPWTLDKRTKGQKDKVLVHTTGMTCPVVLNFNAIRTHCDCDCDAITRVFCWGLVSSFFFLFFLFLGQGKGSFPSLDSPHHCNYKGKKKTQNEVNVTEQGS